MADEGALAPAATGVQPGAADCERELVRNPVGRLFRYVFQERLLPAFPAGSRLLDLGCGSGEDALWLASRGRVVVGVDVASSMIERARALLEREPLARERVRFEVCAAEAVQGLGEAFDGAYSDFGALNCGDLKAIGRALARVLRPGAALVLSLAGPSPLPRLLSRAPVGRGEARGAWPADVPAPTHYPTLARVRRAFGPEFTWSGGFSLGALVPDPGHADWVVRHPQAFGVLAALESVVRSWPLLRALGDHNVLLGRRA